MSASLSRALAAEAVGTAPAVPYVVGLYIGAAYWFTASTSFANAQAIGAVAALAFFGWLLAGSDERSHSTLLNRPSERSSKVPAEAAVSHFSVDER